MKFLICFLFSISAFAKSNDDFNHWLQNEKSISIERLLKNISVEGTLAGTVVASPSKNDPNYYFHWVRDASLTMNTIVTLAESANGAEKEKYLQILSDFVKLSRSQQLLGDLGEPRFNVDGTVDTIPWSRPQYDGPALRALTLIHFLNSFPGISFSAEIILVIRTDLDFVAKKWDKPCFDLWEELRGFHFYTQVVQQAALRAGADLFASNDYSQIALSMNVELEKYWSPKQNYIGASHDLEKSPSSSYKNDNLDSAVILGVLHSGSIYGFYSAGDEKVRHTAEKLENLFSGIYKISSNAIGRFGDDVYFGGNPWYMTTLAFAEYYYNLAAKSSGEEKSKFVAHGDLFLQTVRSYAGSQGEMAEQFERNSGVPISARDLTWSYAGFLSALAARAEAIEN